MATKDEEILRLYLSVRQICHEINDMFTAIDELMNQKGFPPYSSNLRWETSKALGNPDSWLPYFSQRLYLSKKVPHLAVGLNLMMWDSSCHNRIPFLTCGLMRAEGTMPTASDALYCAGWHADYEGKRATSDSIFLATRDDGEGVEMLYYYLRLTAVDSLEKAERLIGSPLDAMYRSLAEEWKTADEVEKELKQVVNEIKPFTLTLEQIKGDALTK